AVNQQRRLVHVPDPEAGAEHRHQRTERDLRHAEHLQPAQAGLRLAHVAFGEQLQVDPLLLLQLAVERLPGLLEVVEFHGRFHRHSFPGVATWSRMRCLSRLILVVTLLSEMPSTSAISRLLRSSRQSSSSARLSGASAAMNRWSTRSCAAVSWSSALSSIMSWTASSSGTACRRRWPSLRRNEIATFSAMRYIQVENRRAGS